MCDFLDIPFEQFVKNINSIALKPTWVIKPWSLFHSRYVALGLTEWLIAVGVCHSLDQHYKTFSDSQETRDSDFLPFLPGSRGDWLFIGTDFCLFFPKCNSSYIIFCNHFFFDPLLVLPPKSTGLAYASTVLLYTSHPSPAFSACPNSHCCSLFHCHHLSSCPHLFSLFFLWSLSLHYTLDSISALISLS